MRGSGVGRGPLWRRCGAFPRPGLRSAPLPAGERGPARRPPPHRPPPRQQVQRRGGERRAGPPRFPPPGARSRAGRAGPAMAAPQSAAGPGLRARGRRALNRKFHTHTHTLSLRPAAALPARPSRTAARCRPWNIGSGGVGEEGPVLPGGCRSAGR